MPSLMKNGIREEKANWPVYVASYLTRKELEQYSKNEWKEKMLNAIFEISKITFMDKAVTKGDVINSQLFYTDYAQPIISPGNNLFPNPESAKLTYFANMHNIYPNDRGQNRAFYRGKKLLRKS